MQGRDQIGGGDYAVYHRGFSGDSDYDGFRSSRAFGEAVRTDSGASGDTEGTDLFYDHASRLRAAALWRSSKISLRRSDRTVFYAAVLRL